MILKTLRTDIRLKSTPRDTEVTNRLVRNVTRPDIAKACTQQQSDRGSCGGQKETGQELDRKNTARTLAASHSSPAEPTNVQTYRRHHPSRRIARFANCFASRVALHDTSLTGPTTNPYHPASPRRGVELHSSTIGCIIAGFGVHSSYTPVAVSFETYSSVTLLLRHHLVS